MTTYAGGTRVPSGYYLDLRNSRAVTVERDGGVLPGGPDAGYRRVPVLALLAAAPVLGGLFVVAFPVIGFGMAARGLGRHLLAGARAGATELAATVAAPAPLPGHAHLTGGPPAPDAAPADGSAARHAPAPDPTDALEREIDAQRGVVY